MILLTVLCPLPSVRHQVLVTVLLTFLLVNLLLAILLIHVLLYQLKPHLRWLTWPLVLPRLPVIVLRIVVGIILQLPPLESTGPTLCMKLIVEDTRLQIHESGVLRCGSCKGDL